MDSTENWDVETEDANKVEKPQETVVEDTPIVPGYSSFDDYVNEAFDAMRAGIKAANNLPNGENYRYYSCFSSFNNRKNEDIVLLLKTMQNVLNVAGASGNIRRRDIEEKFEVLIEANDLLLDRAGSCMDEEAGIARNPGVELIVSQTRRTNVNGSWNITSFENDKVSASPDSTQAVRLLAGRNIQRPQLMFKDKIDNSPKPWQPRIKDKPNSLKPLAIYIEEGENGEVFNHPYEFELDRFVPPDSQLKKADPVTYKSLEDTPLIIIEKPEDIKILLNDLGKYSEIAIDLEHHSYRTFQGITCLMQISTGDTDYLIDTLSLRSELHELNEIFTKPSILKVFHGADLDIQWLQRDLSLYVVNMFDTHQAAKQLNLPYLSLAYLLKRYCGIDPNKHFQLADWRIRPLPEELMKYAREDTHYLLHIKDILRNALIESANGQTNILKAVYDRSTEICKKIYVKPVWTEESYMNMYRKSQKMFNNKQLYALRELHRWRDVTAREEDDSIGYVLPNHMLLNIAETLPREMQGILACCNPIPPLVRQNLLKLHKIILTARDQPLVKPVLEDDLRKRLTQRNQVSCSEAWNYTPHDIPQDTEARADLSCLLDNVKSSDLLRKNVIVDHTVTIFDSPPVSEDEEVAVNTQTPKRKKILFISPFERYKRVIPMIAEQEAQELEEQRKKEEKEREQKTMAEMETVHSKNRVYEHFKAVAERTNTEAQSAPKGKPPKLSLGQMQGRKRKKDSNITRTEEDEEQYDNDLSTPIPPLNKRIVQGIKKTQDEVEILKTEKKMQRHVDEVETNSQNTDTAVRSIRARTKGDKKANNKELQKKGLLPSDKFDYKEVDFSSFQGGSLGNAASTVAFQNAQPRKKDKRKKRKKQKLNI